MSFEFNLEMTWREAWHFFFAKKTCPKCRKPLERKISSRDDGYAWRRDGLDFEYAHRTTATVAYACRRCKTWHTLADLAVRRRD